MLVEELDKLILADENSGDEHLELTKDGPVDESILARTAFGEFLAVLSLCLCLGGWGWKPGWRFEFGAGWCECMD